MGSNTSCKRVFMREVKKKQANKVNVPKLIKPS